MRVKMNQRGFQVHHIDYTNIGREQFGDLVVICPTCHEELHDWINGMVRIGLFKRQAMERLKHICTVRLLQIHDCWREILDGNYDKEIQENAVDVYA